MRWAVVLLVVALLLASAGVALSQSSASYRLEWNVIAGGGEHSTSASYQVHGTVGQGAASPPHSLSSSYRLGGGYWPGVLRSVELGLRIYLPFVTRG